MKKILGLDLGVSSIGWALVNEAENPEESSSIIKLGVRVNPLTTDEQADFEKGKSITTNADRTLKRGMRRNLQRYKLRRENLIEVLKEQGFIDDDTILAENGNFTTFETLRLRAKAADEQISLEELARVLLNINKKRGYKSNRKCKSAEEEGQVVDSIDVARELYENNLTPGQYVYLNIFGIGKKSVPSFYRSDLEAEFERIWQKQSEFHPELTPELKESLTGKNKSQTWAIIAKPFGLVGKKRDVKGIELKKDNYRLRNEALMGRLDPEDLAIALQEVNDDIRNAGGYLGSISDRSKCLVFNNMTVGQYMMSELEKNPNYSLKNQVFYRSDYMDEFDRIWRVQSAYHPELTDELKHTIRDIVIFYQRPLRSQKGLVNFCEFEPQRKVCPKSSPIYQEFRTWQELNNLTIGGLPLSLDEKKVLAKELQVRESLSGSDIYSLLNKSKNQRLNFKQIDGNRTQSALFKSYFKIIEESGNGEYDLKKLSCDKTQEIVSDFFSALGAKVDFLVAGSLEDSKFFALWHLLYSYEGDNSKSGQESLVVKISELTGLPSEYSKIIAGVNFEPDYGNLSAKAIKKILPFMKDGDEYSVACEKAGYRHSGKSLTKEEIESKVCKDHLESLPKNSLRNPVVEKILNQMVNVVNAIIDEYGKPDEIRIELARELKKSASERNEMTKANNDAKKNREIIEAELKSEFGISSPTRNDIIRYRLWQELGSNGYKTLYSNTYIPKEKLFSKEFDIEHIIPQSRLFDDSFSNKTLESRSINIEKGNSTARDYVLSKYGETGLSSYKANLDRMLNAKEISRTKYNHLLMKESDIPSDFINRDLRDSQYIAKKAKEMLEDVVKYVVSTTGSVTARLREDWQMVDVMKELNWDKYDKLGLTSYGDGKDGQKVRKIEGWTKRNDHRHHAMDALTIAFTKRSYIQYLNNLNARLEKVSDDSSYIDLSDYELDDLDRSDVARVVRAIQDKELHRDADKKLRFNPPMPLDEFRSEAKRQLEDVLVSIKAKNKVVTKNVNYTKSKRDDHKSQNTLTPRGALHKESVYGKISRYATNEENVGSGFDAEKISTVANATYRQALLNRLSEYGGDPKKAFCGANSLEKKPLYLNEMHTDCVPQRVKTVHLETLYTIRKPIDESLKIEKVIDKGIRDILKARLAEYDDSAKAAFSNLDENPIWLNREKGIAIKRVTIDAGVSVVEPLHYKKDHKGNVVYNSRGERIPADYVTYGNNHHIAIYEDTSGHLHEQVVTFYEATSRASMGQPVVDKDYRKSEGWKFLFSMKQNEYFVFPNPQTGFNPSEIDLMDPKNYAAVSENMFRVQKLSSKYYVFRHHLETNVNDESSKTRDVVWKRITAIDKLKGVVKVRVNHIGQIVQVGEY